MNTLEDKSRNRTGRTAKIIFAALVVIGMGALAAVQIMGRLSIISNRSDIGDTPPAEVVLADYENPLTEYFDMPPILYLEVKDAARVLDEITNAREWGAFLDSASYSGFQKSVLYLKLKQRFDELSGLLGFDVTIENVRRFTGGRSAFMLFDIGALEFVFLTDLPDAAWNKSVLNEFSSKYESRKHEGHEYYIKEKADGSLSFFFARIGRTLIVSNNSDFFFYYFQQLSDNENIYEKYAAALNSIFGRDTARNELVMYLDRNSINNLYFRNYWIFNNEDDFDFLLNALITADRNDNGFIERRTMRFAKDSIDIKTNESKSAMEALIPGRAMYYTVSNTAAARRVASDMITELMYIEPVDENEKEQPMPKTYSDILDTFKKASPRQYAYYAYTGDSGLPYIGVSRGIAVSLQNPGSFNVDHFGDLLAETYSSEITVPGSSGFTIQMEEIDSGEIIHTLEIPLFDERAVSFCLSGELLFIANNRDDVLEMVEKYRSGPPAAAVTFAQKAFYDVPAISRSYCELIDVMSGRRDWWKRDTEVYRDNICSLVSVASKIKEMNIVQEIDGDTIHEEARYTID